MLHETANKHWRKADDNCHSNIKNKDEIELVVIISTETQKIKMMNLKENHIESKMTRHDTEEEIRIVTNSGKI